MASAGAPRKVPEEGEEAGDTEEETALTFSPHLLLVGVKICMEVLLVRLAGGSVSFCRLGQGGLDAKCDRAGVLQALWAVPSTLEGKTRRKHSNTAQKEKKKRKKKKKKQKQKQKQTIQLGWRRGKFQAPLEPA